MKLIKLIFCLTFLFGQSFISRADEIGDRITDMQMKFIKCYQANDSKGAYAISDSLKEFALSNNRIKIYYLCYNNLIKMECIRGKYPAALKLVEEMYNDINERKTFDYLSEYYKGLATIHSERGDNKSTLEYLLKANETSKTPDRNIYIRLATQLINMDRPNEAIEWANKAYYESTSKFIRSNALFYKMYAFFSLEKKDSFDIYHQLYTSLDKSVTQPNFIPYVGFMRNYMDGNYKEAIAVADSIIDEDERLRHLILALYKSKDLESAFSTQKKLIKHKDSIMEIIMHEDINALMHSMELTTANAKLAKQERTNLILIIIITIIIIIASTILNITRYKFTRKLKRQNNKLNEALEEVNKSKRIKRAMVEDIKDKSQQPTDMLRTYSKAIVTPDFNLAFASTDITNNIKKSTDSIRLLLDPVVNMYKSDEKAQMITSNGKTQIENSQVVLIDTINSLLGFLDIIKTVSDSLPEEEKQNVLEQMHIGMKDIAIMFDTMLDMVYYDNYDSLEMNEKVSINELCHSVINEFIQRHKDDVELSFSTDINDSVSVTTNYNAIYKMVRYTLDNADKFTLKGNINIHCSEKDNKTIISITDTGCGIKKEERELVFERFFKSECKYPGIGLSLPICRKIGSLIGCTISLDESYTGGCKFDITFQSTM